MSILRNPEYIQRLTNALLAESYELPDDETELMEFLAQAILNPSEEVSAIMRDYVTETEADATEKNKRLLSRPMKTNDQGFADELHKNRGIILHVDPNLNKKV